VLRTGKDGEQDKKFITDFDESVTIPLSPRSRITSWNANISGTDKDLALSEKASLNILRFYRAVAFKELKED